MDPDAHPRSFSAGRRWGIFFSVSVSITAFLAIVVMLNYLGARHYRRLSWSTQTRYQLAPLTLNLLRSITNEVTITIYFDRNNVPYQDVADLLREYHLQNPKIVVQTVDYITDNAAAQKIKLQYELGSADTKDCIILAYGDKHEVIAGRLLADSEVKRVATDQSAGAPEKPSYEVHHTKFNGERILDGYLRVLTSDRQFLAGYVWDQGDQPHLDGQRQLDYTEFYDILYGSGVRAGLIILGGTNEIPDTCNLLIIAGPTRPFSTDQIREISRYLDNGGRLLVLLNNGSVPIKSTHIEPLLARWGVEIGTNYVTDADNDVAAASGAAPYMAVRAFSQSPDSLVNPLNGSYLDMFTPRSVRRAPNASSSLSVEELAYTGPNGVLHQGDTAYPHQQIPLIVAVKKDLVQGGVQRGQTRIVVAGDCWFLGNDPIKSGDNANGDFVRFAANWLLEQTPALEGVGPRPMTEYKLSLTNAQSRSIRWMFLAGMPGGILLFGGLVWLRRRN
jgi:hypothetical protein